MHMLQRCSTSLSQTPQARQRRPAWLPPSQLRRALDVGKGAHMQRCRCCVQGMGPCWSIWPAGPSRPGVLPPSDSWQAQRRGHWLCKCTEQGARQCRLLAGKSSCAAPAACPGMRLILGCTLEAHTAAPSPGPVQTRCFVEQMPRCSAVAVAVALTVAVGAAL